jgi:hypothetical protein
MENFLTTVEKGLDKEGLEVFAERLGWLNMLNPDVVDRSYRLNLENSDEHKTAEYLVHLAVIEPGENWMDEHWSATRCIGQWELPASWEEEGGVPDEGILTLRYYTGPGCDKPAYRREWWSQTMLCKKLEAMKAAEKDSERKAREAQRKREEADRQPEGEELGDGRGRAAE